MAEAGSVFEKLIHDCEFENQQYVRVIAHEDQLIENLREEIKNKHLEYQKFQDSISQLDGDIRIHHKQFDRNRDNVDSLKKTNQVLTDHVAAVTQKLEMKRAKHHTEKHNLEEVLVQHKEKWIKYERIYEQMPAAKELRRWEAKVATLDAACDQKQAKLAEMKRQIHLLENKSQYDEMTMNEFIVQIAEMHVSTQKLASEIERKKAEQTASLQQKDERAGCMDSNIQQVSEMQIDDGEGEAMLCEDQLGDNLKENENSKNEQDADEEMQIEDANQSYHQDSQKSLVEKQLQRPPIGPGNVPALSRQFQAAGLQQVPAVQTVYNTPILRAPQSMVRPSMPSQPQSMVRLGIRPQLQSCRPGMPSHLQSMVRPGMPAQSQSMVRPSIPSQSQSMVRPGIPSQLQQQRLPQAVHIQRTSPQVQPRPSLGNRYASIQKPSLPTFSDRNITSQPCSTSSRPSSVQGSSVHISANRSTPQKQQQSMHNFSSTATALSIHTANNSQMAGAIPKSTAPGVNSKVVPVVPKSGDLPGRTIVAQPFMINQQLTMDKLKQNRMLQNPPTPSVTSQGKSSTGFGIPMVSNQLKATTLSHPPVTPQVCASFNPRQMQPAVSTKLRVENVIPASPHHSHSFVPRRSLPGLVANTLAQGNSPATVSSVPVPRLPTSTILSSVSTPKPPSVAVPNAPAVPATVQSQNRNSCGATMPSPVKTQAQNFALIGKPSHLHQKPSQQQQHLQQQQLYQQQQQQQQHILKQQQQVPAQSPQRRGQQSQQTPPKVPLQQHQRQQPEQPPISVSSKMPSPLGSVPTTSMSQSAASLTTRPAKGTDSFPDSISQAGPAAATREEPSRAAKDKHQASSKTVPPSPKILRTSYSDLGETYTMKLKTSPGPQTNSKHSDSPMMSSPGAGMLCSPGSSLGDHEPNMAGKLNGDDGLQDSPFTMEKHHQRLAELNQSPGYPIMYTGGRRMFEKHGKSNDMENCMDAGPLEMQPFGQPSEDITCVMFGGGGDLTNQQAAKDVHGQGLASKSKQMESDVPFMFNRDFPKGKGPSKSGTVEADVPFMINMADNQKDDREDSNSNFMLNFGGDNTTNQDGPLGSGQGTNMDTEASGMFGWNFESDSSDQTDSLGIQSLFGQSSGKDEPVADNTGFFLNFGSGSTVTSPPTSALSLF